MGFFIGGREGREERDKEAQISLLEREWERGKEGEGRRERQRVEKRESWVGERKRKKRRKSAEFCLLKGQGSAAHVHRDHTAGQGSSL